LATAVEVQVPSVDGEPARSCGGSHAGDASPRPAGQPEL